MKSAKIGLLGAVLNNNNLGCVALTLSLIKTLEEVADSIDYDFEYYIFEAKKNYENAINKAYLIGVDKKKIHSFQISSLYKMASHLKHPWCAIEALMAINKCDFFIDLTEGDSFTDIYGQERFDGKTRIKELVEQKRKPLILGPQTYGPFNKSANLDRAKKVIEQSLGVMARDQTSADYVNSFSRKYVFTTTDLAFSLPMTQRQFFSKDRINVGINISSLLISKKAEVTKTEFSLTAHYDEYIRLLLHFFQADPLYEVFIVPHVGEDGGFAFKELYPEFKYLDPFDNPIAAKNFISGLDIFIGSRMHATIAAFSSGVVTIPVGYSRKFIGLYNSLGYDYVVDLQHMNERQAYEKTIEYVNNYKNIDITECLEKANSMNQAMKEQFQKYIVEALQK